MILFFKENFKMIKLIESYIIWGYTKKKIEELLRKRGRVIIG